MCKASESCRVLLCINKCGLYLPNLREELKVHMEAWTHYPLTFSPCLIIPLNQILKDDRKKSNYRIIEVYQIHNIV
jgi:hypothetical protein